MKSLTFSCLICALNRGATKPIFCSKVAQKGKTSTKPRVIVPQYGSSKNTVFVWGKNIAWVSGVSGEKEKDGSEKGREVEGGFGQMMYRSPERSPQDSRDGIFCTVPRPHFLGRALIWPGCFGEHILGLFGLYPSSLSKSLGFVSLSGKAWLVSISGAILFLRSWHVYFPLEFEFRGKSCVEWEHVGENGISCFLPCILLGTVQ